MNCIEWKDFIKLDIRVGTIIKAENFPEARKPAHKLWIDFGNSGIKKSSAQITKLYTPKELINKQIIAVVNFPPKQIANFISDCLVLGVVLDKDRVILVQPDKKVPNGYRIM